MSLKERIVQGEFVITAEIGPPKGKEVAQVLKTAEELMPYIDAVNVTDLQSAVMRLGSLAMCIFLRQRGIEPIMQVACRDRNRLALQSDILSAAAHNIPNILILTGDHPVLGDHPDAKPVFDLDSVQLLEVVKKLEEGFDMRGNKLEGEPPHFYKGAVVNPGARPLEPQILKMEKKIEAGAEFFQTQGIYDIKIFEHFIHKTSHLKVPVLAGIIPLKSDTMARYINKNLAGVSVPDVLIRQMQEAQNKAEKSIEITSSLIKGLKGMCQGIHLMALGWERFIPDILASAQINRK
ncbi:MAG: 5,10-methylenetetrahydrofolate reductase [Candidatus Omnitrophota bacterium]|jgi:5,10-methylenetetrahydrofolate reductase|nr:MAG: 5,10-methylenetetrahydrofolate reductase [Candidatus Omnitrophota bacterium]